ncbi:19671_t:CDS:2, partial [Gigaspora margarita]
AHAVNSCSKGEPARTQGFELYCIPEAQEEGDIKTLVNNNEDPEEKTLTEIKVMKDEKNDATKSAKILDEIKIVKKTDKMDEMFESSLKIGIDVEKETLWNYQKPTERDSKKNAAIACRMDSNKEKEEEKGKRIGENSKIYQINQGFRYLPMNLPFPQIFDLRGDCHFTSP